MPFWAPCWNASSIKWSFAKAGKASRPRAGFVIFDRQCRCSRGAPLIRGRILSTPSCGHHRRIASRFEVFYPNNRARVIRLLRSAWKHLETLHRDGLCHGDATHYNILVDASGSPFWIDTDSMVATTFGASIDYAVYMAHAVAPLLSRTETAAFQNWAIERMPSRLRRESIRLLGLTLAETANWHHRERGELQSLRTKFAATTLFARELSYHWQQLPADHESPTAYVAALHRQAQQREEEVSRLESAAQHLAAELESERNERARLIVSLNTPPPATHERAAASKGGKVVTTETAPEHGAAERLSLIAPIDSVASAAAPRPPASDALACDSAGTLAQWQARAAAAEKQLLELSGAVNDATARADALAQWQARAAAAEQQLAELSATVAQATARADTAEQECAARLALIERLDNVASCTARRADVLDELASARADALAQWQARAAAAEQQLGELTATVADTAARADGAERECAARLVVIEELSRARDAFAAALVARPWRSRLRRLLSRGGG